MHALTPRQLEIIRFIRDYRSNQGYSPTMQEIGDHFGLTKVTVFEHVGALEKKGCLRRTGRHQARSLLVSNKFQFEDERPTKITLAGKIAAGLPIEAMEERQILDLDEVFLSKYTTFALQVSGNSMIDDHICDGDFVICDRRTDPDNGEMVVALLENGEATLKRFYREKDKMVRLQPANPDFQPLSVPEDQINIQGVVVGVVRRTK